jgi:hypothetical protein
MKLKQIAFAVAAMASAFAAQADTVVVNGQPHEVVYLSGASAPDNFLADIAEGLLSNITYFASGSNYRAYAGTAVNGIVGIEPGTRILFIKRSVGGSAFGVNPVARAQRIKTIDVTQTTGGAGTKASPYVATIVGADPGEANHGDAGNVGRVPDFGVSDVEPALFQGPLNTENDTEGLSPSDVARLSVQPVNQLIFGLVATDTVPASVHFSRAAYGAILNGQITSWDQVDPSLSGDVVVCRRSAGSGTQAAYNWYFGHFPSDNFLEPARGWSSAGWKEGGSGTTADPYIINPASGNTVIENASSGNVRSCLKAANDGTDYLFTTWDSEDQANRVFKVTFSETGPVKAIGILSFDSYTSAASNNFSFRHLDGAGTYTYDAGTQTFSSSAGATGVAPSKANVINGKYDFFVELSIQSRSVAVSNEHGDPVPAIGGIQKAFADEFVKRAGSPKFTGNFENTGAQVSTPFAFVSLPQYYAGLTTSGGAQTDGNGVRYADLYVSKYSRDANTRRPLQYFGN